MHTLTAPDDTAAKPTPQEQAAAFRNAVTAYEDRVRDRIGASAYADSTAVIRKAYGGRLPNEQLADAVDGLDLDRGEWHLLEWFLSWDAQDVLASILLKARAQCSSPAVEQ